MEESESDTTKVRGRKSSRRGRVMSVDDFSLDVISSVQVTVRLLMYAEA